MAYVDDIVLFAENEEEMAGLVTGLKKYLNKKKLKINANEPKVKRFKYVGGRKKKWTAKWKVINIPVKEF